MEARNTLIYLALAEIDSTGMSTNHAAKKYNIPEATLRRHRKKRHLISSVGRPTTFTKLEEDALEEMLLLCSEFQIGMGRLEFLRVVNECAVTKGVISAGKRLSVKWFRGFRLRHPRISERVTEAKNIKKIKEWTNDTAKEYIKLLQSLMDDGYLNDPAGIFNYDESPFKLAVLNSKTLAAKGKQYVHSFATGTNTVVLNIVLFMYYVYVRYLLLLS